MKKTIFPKPMGFSIILWLAVATCVGAAEVYVPCAHPIADRYIVVLDEAVVVPSAAKATRTETLRETSDALALQYGGQRRALYKSALAGFSVSIDADNARHLATDPRVIQVEQVCPVHLSSGSQFSPGWALDRVDQRNLPLDNVYNYDHTGQGVHIFVVDTGIHPIATEFGQRLMPGANLHPDHQPWDTDDCTGHGTAVASVAAGEVHGVAKDAFLYPVRVFNCNGTSDSEIVTKGVEWIDSQNPTNGQSLAPKIVNMSLAVLDWAPGVSAMEMMIENSMDKGTIYVASANNSNQDACRQSPSRIPSVITVAASNASGQPWIWSNWGTCVDLWAPGEGVPTVALDGSTVLRDGTSFAAPMVAGTIALYLEDHPQIPSSDPRSKVDEVTDWLLAAATPGVLVGDLGPGSPNLLLYTRYDNSPPSARYDVLELPDCTNAHTIWHHQVLDNDNDPNNDFLRVCDPFFDQPLYGHSRVHVTAWKYTPDPEFCARGSDSFSYQINDRVDCTGLTDAAPIILLAPVDGEIIHEDFFESADLTAWTGQWVPTGGALIASQTAALTGDYGLEVVIDNTTHAFLSHNSSQLETHYHARFLFDPTHLTMTEGDSHALFAGLEHQNGPYTIQLRLRRNGGEYQLKLDTWDDNGSWSAIGSWVTIANSLNVIGLEWWAAQAGSHDGGIRLFVDGQLAGEKLGLDNDEKVIGRVRFGAIGPKAGTQGSYYIDDFRSWRGTN